MIVKRNFSPEKVWQYIKKPMWFVMAWSSLVWLLPTLLGYELPSINFTPIGVLGSALAIFIAFRNNSAYARWWEARQIWGGIINSSRILARLLITFTESHLHPEKEKQVEAEFFKKEMVLRCIAWAHSLRFHLRKQESWKELKPLLKEADYDELVQTQNKPNYLHLMMGKEIYKAMGNGILGGFDSFQLEGQLAALANYQGGAERIKNTPLPRQYDFFTRVFVYLFSFLLPFGLLGFFQSESSISYSWLVIPFSSLLAGVFVIMERTGAANENPFENAVTDIPMTSLCNTIERDLKEMIGDKNLPMKIEAIDGYIF